MSRHFERHWRHPYDREEKSERVDVLAYLMADGGVPLNDKYGATGDYTRPRAMAVIVRANGQLDCCNVDELWRIEE